MNTCCFIIHAQDMGYKIHPYDICSIRIIPMPELKLLKHRLMRKIYMDQIKSAYNTYESISEAHEHGYGLSIDCEQEFDTSSRIQIEKECILFEQEMYEFMKNKLQSLSVAVMTEMGIEPATANMVSTSIRQIYDQSPTEKLLRRVVRRAADL